MNNPNKKRLRRTMMFLNAQKPGLIKDPYIYKPDSIMLDLEDAVAENQKDAAGSTAWTALTGKKISAALLPVDVIPSVSRKQKAHRM